MSDYEKVTTFCKDVRGDRKYPYSLKNLIGISEETKHILLDVIRKYQKNNSNEKSGYIESELIRRFLQPTPFLKKRIDMIEGPFSAYRVYSPKSSDHHFPHIFYLFGDFHRKISECGDIPRFHTWIKDTIINSPVFIDVYLETPYKYKKYKSIDDEDLPNCYMQDFYLEFKDCFLHSKTNKYCQTSRFHYVDIRRLYETHDQQKGNDAADDLRYQRLTDEKEIQQRIVYFNRFIDYLVNPKSIVNRRIKKQFEAIQNEYIKRTLMKCFEDCLKIYEEKLIHLKLDNIGSRAFNSIIDTVGDYEVCLMDYYLIARCFRSYDKKKGYNRPSYNNIIYVGNGHILNYLKIFRKLGFLADEVGEAEDVEFDVEEIWAAEKKQCLDISNINQPLFNERYTK